MVVFFSHNNSSRDAWRGVTLLGIHSAQTFLVVNIISNGAIFIFILVLLLYVNGRDGSSAVDLLVWVDWERGEEGSSIKNSRFRRQLRRSNVGRVIVASAAHCRPRCNSSSCYRNAAVARGAPEKKVTMTVAAASEKAYARLTGVCECVCVCVLQ